jgi:hypothetical protein
VSNPPVVERQFSKRLAGFEGKKGDQGRDRIHSRPDTAEKIGVFQHSSLVGPLFIMAARDAVANIILEDNLSRVPTNDRREEPLPAAWNPCGPLLAYSDICWHTTCPLFPAMAGTTFIVKP